MGRKEEGCGTVTALLHSCWPGPARQFWIHHQIQELTTQQVQHVQCTCCVVMFCSSCSLWFSTNLPQTGSYSICGPEPLNSARRPQEVCSCHVRCIFTQNILDLDWFYLVVFVPQKDSGTGSVCCWCPPAECCSTASNQTACMCQHVSADTLKKHRVSRCNESRLTKLRAGCSSRTVFGLVRISSPLSHKVCQPRHIRARLERHHKSCAVTC